MSRVTGFPPLADPKARILVLGSMPGKASLAANQYYAHPRNAFWSVVESVFAIDCRLPYRQRCDALVDRGIAVWDVLQHCDRPGSLDAAIDPASIIVNDFPVFFAEHPALTRICFNGATAERVFRRRVVPGLADADRFTMIRLPSTSPAHAAMSVAQKAEAWRSALLTSVAAR